MDVITLLAKAAAARQCNAATSEKRAFGNVIRGAAKGLFNYGLKPAAKLYGNAMAKNPLATAMASGAAAYGGHNLGQSQLAGLQQQHGNLYEAQQSLKPWSFGADGGLKSNIGEAAGNWMSSPLGSLYAMLSGPGKKQDVIPGSSGGGGMDYGDWEVNPTTGQTSRDVSGRQSGRLGREAQQNVDTYNQLRQKLRPVLGDEWYKQQEGGSSRPRSSSSRGLSPDDRELLNRVQYYFGPDANFKIHGASRLADPWNSPD